MRFVKSMLNVGQLHSPDGVVKITPEKLRRFEASFQRMRNKTNQSMVPVQWDHVDDLSQAFPLSKDEFRKRSAKDTIGFLDDFRVAENGQSANITLQLFDDEAAKAAEENRVYVSPIIQPTWKDGDGDTYEDFIAHCDLVNWPVDQKQTPFEKIDDTPVIACSIRLAQEPEMENENKTDGKTDDKTDGMNAAKMIAELGDMLGVELPDGVAPESDAGVVAILTVAKNKLKGDEVDEADDVDDDEPVETAETGMVAMSAEAKFAQNLHRERIEDRLQLLLESGRVKPSEHKAAKAQAAAVKLSLDKSGNHEKSAVEHFIASRESIPEGTFWSAEEKTKRMSLESPKPEVCDDDSNDDVKSIANWALGRK